MYRGGVAGPVLWTTVHSCSRRRKICNSSITPTFHHHPRLLVPHQLHPLPPRKHAGRPPLLQKDANPLQYHFRPTMEFSSLLSQAPHCLHTISLGNKGCYCSHWTSSYDALMDDAPDFSLYYAHLHEHICISLDTIARTLSNISLQTHRHD